MTPVERVCAILAERDLERFAPGPHTERLRKDLALGWQPTAERIVEAICEPVEAPPEAETGSDAISMPCEVQSGCGEASKRVWPWWL